MRVRRRSFDDEALKSGRASRTATVSEVQCISGIRQKWCGRRGTALRGTVRRAARPSRTVCGRTSRHLRCDATRFGARDPSRKNTQRNSGIHGGRRCGRGALFGFGAAASEAGTGSSRSGRASSNSRFRIHLVSFFSFFCFIFLFKDNFY